MGHNQQITGRVLGYKAEQVVAFTLRYFLDHGVVPSQEQICAAVGLATKGEVSRIEKSIGRRGLKVDRQLVRKWKEGRK